jgi:hypothetical protein
MLKYDKQDKQGKTVFNKHNHHMTQQQATVARSQGGPQTKIGQSTRQITDRPITKMINNLLLQRKQINDCIIGNNLSLIMNLKKKMIEKQPYKVKGHRGRGQETWGRGEGVN